MNSVILFFAILLEPEVSARCGRLPIGFPPIGCDYVCVCGHAIGGDDECGWTVVCN